MIELLHLGHEFQFAEKKIHAIYDEYKGEGDDENLEWNFG